MTDFIQGESRTQSTLFPEALDDYIQSDNPIRVIDAFIDQLDLKKLEFARSEPSHTGRPAYAPGTLLKLYLYGYLNRIQSSRRLQREAQRNVELMWLLQRLTPDFKTIADFRKDNGKGIKNVCRTFVELCRKLDMFTDTIIAIDGSKFKAVNNSDKNFTQANIKRRIEITEKNIARYLEKLDQQDQAEVDDHTGSVESKVQALKAHLTELHTIDDTIQKTDVRQVSLTDPDCRAMKTQSIGRTVGYNVQSAVDTKHHLIVAHEVTNHVSDRAELYPMGLKTQSALQKRHLTVVADKGYYSGEMIKACQDAGMTPLVAKTDYTSKSRPGMFARDTFIYDATEDVYICPAKQKIPYSFETFEHGKLMRGYISIKICKNCHLKDRCTTSKARRIKRWVHEEQLDQMEQQVQAMPKIMTLRKSTVEHPFGTIKSWMGATHFLTKRLKNVSTEMNLHVLAYNMKRMINIMGSRALMEAIKTQ